MKLSFIIFSTLLGGLFAQSDWWQHAQFYQIYPRSFKDSNGDGIGDLNGITEKLPYLKDIGITATWLSPIFKSPMKDFGYDISNYTAIQPEYGTMEDFERLIKRANQLGLKIILDLVPNHSSDKHQWFINSVNNVSGYEDFYVWHPGKPDPNNSTNRLPPSNWLSVFRGSAWKWNEKRKQFYLHQFLAEQPDLNYRNPKVIEAMKNVMKFWLDKGVAGFRVDAVPLIYEVEQFDNGTYPDEPRSYVSNDTDNWQYLDHIHTYYQPETITLVYQARAFMDEYQRINGGDTRILLTESDGPIDTEMECYGNGTHKGAQIPFNFHFITKIHEDSKAKDYIETIKIWMDHLPEGASANWVFGNHDCQRASTRYGLGRIDEMNMLLMVLPGASVTYNGEEIGMLDLKISWNDTVDPAACRTNPDIYEQFSRDPARTPFQWDDSKNAGFSTGNKTWLPVNPNHKQLNVKAQLAAKRSHLKVYKDLTALRRTSRALEFGDTKYEALNENVVGILRHLPGYNSIIFLMNISDKSQTVNVHEFSPTIPPISRIKIVNVESKRKPGDLIKMTSITLAPYEALVLEQFTSWS